MNQQNLRADAHKQIEKIFKTLLPARGLSYREAQVQLSHTMLVPFCLVFHIVSILALTASVPYWKILGLIP